MKTKKKKGFTLIELLAIIVILAIIAVITVPIILGIIEDAKRGAAEDSAHGYKDAIEKYYVTEYAKQAPNEVSIDGEYSVNSENGSLVGSTTLPINFSGKVPTGGKIKIINKIVSGCLEFDEYKVDIDEKGNVKKAIEGACGVKYYSAETIKNDDNAVYYNPGYKDETTDIPAAKCTREQYLANLNTSSPVKNGCMRWWAYSEQTLSNGTKVVNLILDHNTTIKTEWANGTDYTTNPTGLGITYTEKKVYNEAKNNKGPQTLLKNLKEDTKYWQTSITSDYNYSVNDEYASYSIDYGNNNYKARLITLEEVLTIANKTNNDDTFIYLDIQPTQGPNTTTRDTNKYSWLIMNTWNCETWSGCKEQTYAFNTYGFWTATSSPNVSTGAQTTESWAAYEINFQGSRTILNVTNNTSSGIRPVISVAKDSL